jgi:hypothetical protein
MFDKRLIRLLRIARHHLFAQGFVESLDPLPVVLAKEDHKAVVIVSAPELSHPARDHFQPCQPGRHVAPVA